MEFNSKIKAPCSHESSHLVLPTILEGYNLSIKVNFKMWVTLWTRHLDISDVQSQWEAEGPLQLWLSSDQNRWSMEWEVAQSLSTHHTHLLNPQWHTESFRFSVSPLINLPQGKISPPQGNTTFWLLLFVLLQKIYEKITPGYNKHCKGRDWRAKEEAGLKKNNNSGSENTGTTWPTENFICNIDVKLENH